MNDLILYTTEDGRSQIKLRAKDQTVWLSQREMAQLFDVSTDNVGLHLKNIYEDGELSREATTEDSSVVQNGGRERHKTGFQPSGMGVPHTWGGAPGWYGFGPLALQTEQQPKTQPARLPNRALDAHAVLPSFAPTAHFYTSLGQRPRTRARKPYEG